MKILDSYKNALQTETNTNEFSSSKVRRIGLLSLGMTWEPEHRQGKTDLCCGTKDAVDWKGR